MEGQPRALESTTTNEIGHGIQVERLRSLLRHLIDIYSPSGKEEEILGFLRAYLKDGNLPVSRQPIDDHRYNLLVIPPETEIRLVMVGHVDTVVAHDLERYEYEEEGDSVIGLGAADMKGGCAAMIEAYHALWEAGYSRPPVALALVAGEEEEGDGAEKLVEDLHVPWAIIGEPTNLRPCTSHYGYLEVEITTRGRRMHASLANMAQNAIQNMLRLLLKVSLYLENKRPEVVYNIRELSSSETGFAVPDRCDAWLDIHLPPTAPVGEIIMEIEEIVSEQRRENPDFKASIHFVTVHAGYRLPEKGPIIEILKTIYARHSIPWEPQPFPSHSDANLLWAAGVKPILMGPGQLEKAHAPDEAVSFSQVVQAARLYLDLLVALSAKVSD